MIKRRKGFTIVELVIVIAVIAVLAAVLIPTFVSITKKANMSADQVAVKNMNTALAAAEVEREIKTFNDVLDELGKMGYNVKDYKPLTANTYFYWDMKENRILHVDETDTILYPTNLKNAEYSIGKWWSLSGLIPEEDLPTISSGVAEVNTAGELVALANAFKENSVIVSGLTTVKINEDIDLKGASLTFGKVTSTFTIMSDKTPAAKIYNMNTQENTAFTDRPHNVGLIGELPYGIYDTITIRNLELVNPNAGSFEDGKSSIGILVGQLYHADLKIIDVTITNGEVKGHGKVGSVVGRSRGTAKIEMTNVVVKHTKVYANYDSAKVIGSATSTNKTANLKFTNCNFDGIEIYGMRPADEYIKDGDVIWETQAADPQNNDNTLYWNYGKQGDIYTGVADAIAWVYVAIDGYTIPSGNSNTVSIKGTYNGTEYTFSSVYGWSTIQLDDSGNYSN